MTPFEQTLLNHVWRRYKRELIKGEWVETDSLSEFVSSYGPAYYLFSHPDYPKLYPCWGLGLKDRPAGMQFTGMRIVPNELSEYELYYTIQRHDPEVIYDAYVNGKAVVVEGNSVRVLL